MFITVQNPITQIFSFAKSSYAKRMKSKEKFGAPQRNKKNSTTLSHSGTPQSPKPIVSMKCTMSMISDVEVPLSPQYLQTKIVQLEENQQQMERIFKERVEDVNRRILERDKESNLLKLKLFQMKKNLAQKKIDLKLLKLTLRAKRALSGTDYQNPQSAKESALCSVKLNAQHSLSNQKHRSKSKTKPTQFKSSSKLPKAKLLSCKSLF